MSTKPEEWRSRGGEGVGGYCEYELKTITPYKEPSYYIDLYILFSLWSVC